MATTGSRVAVRSTALALLASFALTACGTSPAPGSVTPVQTAAADVEAASLAPATELRILGGAKFKDGGAGLKFVAVRGGKEIARTLEMHPMPGGKWTATLNGHVVNRQYFEGREGRMVRQELATLNLAEPERFTASARQVQVLPAVVTAVGVTTIVCYAVDLTVRTSIWAAGRFIGGIIDAIIGKDVFSPGLFPKWTILLPFNRGYAPY
ncbi:MAG: hypothetical protein VKP72_08875 [bacterium]|nr:hypothetical protein [bacterium]